MRDEYLDGIMARNDNPKGNTMAKKTKTDTAAAPAAGATAAPAAAAKDSDRGGNDVFVPVFEGGKPKEPTTKLAPQAKTILNTVVAAGKNGIKRSELVAKLPAAGLVTKQPPGRIVTYYQKDLVASGSLILTKSTTPAAPAAAPAAPAAAPAAPAAQ